MCAIPWKKLRYDTDSGGYILNASREQIEDAPVFEKENRALLDDPDWNRDLIEYFDSLPLWDY